MGRREGPDPPPPLPILSPLRPVLRCAIGIAAGGTNSYDCPLPALSDACSGTEGITGYSYGTNGPLLECVATPPSTPPSSPPSANKYCKKLKRLKQAKKHVKKREGNEEKWEKKCSPSPPIDL